jgi:PGF-CTERM protein
MKRSALAVFLTVLLVAGLTVAPAAAQGEREAYSGANVSFETDERAVVDYRVDGALLFESVATEARSDDAGAGVGADAGADVDLSAVSGLQGAALSMGVRTETRATVETDGSAEMTVHDSERGHLVVGANGEPQFVEAELGADATVETEDDRRAVVTTGDGSHVTAIVVGDGSVAVNGNDDLVVHLEGDAKVVFRASGEERDEDDAEAERLITDGEAAVEVYVDHANGETVSDTVRYDDDTTAEAQADAENAVDVTVERTTDEGTVVLTSVSEGAIGATEDLSVTVDGEAATQVESVGDLEGAVEDGLAFAVAQHANADANAEVLVAVDGFSERTITLDGADSEGDDDADDEQVEGDDTGVESQPGFGVVAALIALLIALFAIRR